MLLTSVFALHQSWKALLMSLLLLSAYVCSIEIGCVLFLLVCAGICCCQICWVLHSCFGWWLWCLGVCLCAMWGANYGILIQPYGIAHELDCQVVDFRRTYTMPSFGVGVCVVSYHNGGGKLEFCRHILIPITILKFDPTHLLIKMHNMSPIDFPKYGVAYVLQENLCSCGEQMRRWNPL